MRSCSSSHEPIVAEVPQLGHAKYIFAMPAEVHAFVRRYSQASRDERTSARQKRQKCVVWLEARETAFNWLQLAERLFFALQVCLDLHVGGVQAFVAKPKCDHCDFDSGLKKVHRRGVSAMSSTT